eukprot:s5279_g3.t1
MTGKRESESCFKKRIQMTDLRGLKALEIPDMGRLHQAICKHFTGATSGLRAPNEGFRSTPLCCAPPRLRPRLAAVAWAWLSPELERYARYAASTTLN